MSRRIAIYTVVTGGYDTPKLPRHRIPGADYFLITDGSETLPGYTTVKIEAGDSAVKAQRRAKILPWEYLPKEYDVILYYDASYQITGNLRQFLHNYGGGLGICRHPARNCIYEEGKRILELNKATSEAVTEQLNAYRELGMPANYGLQESGILIRDNVEATKRLCTVWWDELSLYCHRDQLGLPAAIFKTGIQPNYLRRNLLHANFSNNPHKVVKVYRTEQPKRIWYLQPYASDLMIGAEYNAQIRCVPDDDWICILDQDVIFLHPKTKAQIQEIVNSDPPYELLGCMLSRIGSGYQCPGGKISHNHDMLHHFKIAEQLHKEQYGVVTDHKRPIAGALMLFPKSVWKKHPFYPNGPHFDSEFGFEVLKYGKIGLMQGVYLYHFYRAYANGNPQHYKQHLINTTWTR